MRQSAEAKKWRMPADILLRQAMAAPTRGNVTDPREFSAKGGFAGLETGHAGQAGKDPGIPEGGAGAEWLLRVIADDNVGRRLARRLFLAVLRRRPRSTLVRYAMLFR